MTAATRLRLIGRRVAAATLFVALAALGTSPAARCQEMTRRPVDMPERWEQGFARAVRGELLIYPWAYPGQASALLSRTTDGSMIVEWEGAPAGDGAPDEPVTWLWHAGLASGYGAHRFTLSLNGAAVATFTSGRDAADREWAVENAPAGTTLAFKTTRVGTFNELFGFMMLTVPRGLAGTGAPRFTVTPESAGNRDYYMTFQQEVRAWTRVLPVQAVLNGGRRAVRVDVSHLGRPERMVVRSGDAEAWSGSIGPGHTGLVLPMGPATAGGSAAVASASPAVVTVDVGDTRVFSESVTLPAVRAWRMHLLPHSHVDIGYSDPQPEVEKKQWTNLEDAIALARESAGNPTESRFRWNVEGLWSVESYLKQATPEARRAFVEAVRQGTIGLQANYTNILTGLCTPEELRHWTDAARALGAAHGLPAARSAMHTDIPGLSWTVVAALAEAGVRYFSSGPNYMPGLPDGGDRIGHTLRATGDKPFWWLSPSGQERVLFWMAGRGYSWFHGLNTGAVGPATRDQMLDYLGELAGKGYAYDMVQVRYTIGGDNGPVDRHLPAFVKAWNETFDAPVLVINTADAFFAEFERRYGASLPTLSGDMTPYWEDGAVSTASEEAMVRGAVRRLEQAEALWSMRAPAAFPAAEAAEAWRQALLWHEHTWGAADSVNDPDRADVVGQWRYKRAFAVEADHLATALLEAAKPAPPKPPPPLSSRHARLMTATMTVEVANTLSWARSGLAVLPKTVSFPGNRVSDARGRALPAQRLASGDLSVWVADVPALGSVRLTVAAGEAADPVMPVAVEAGALDNGLVRVEVDRDTGAIRTLRWRRGAAAATRAIDPGAGTELAEAPGIGAYLYVPGLDPSRAEGAGTPKVSVETRGPLMATLRVESDAPGTKGLVRRVTLVAGSDEVRLDVELDKSMVRDKESAHLAFPFAVPGGVVRVDQGEAVVEIPRDQLAGSCRDFVGAQHAIDLSNAEIGVSLAALDAPLVELGALTDERRVNGAPRAWRETVAPDRSLYAYLLNNYWHTNYKADQDGTIRFRFVLRPHGAFDHLALRRFGSEQHQPLVAYGLEARTPAAKAAFQVTGAGVTVAGVKPIDEGRALLVRLANAAATPTRARLTSPVSGRLLRGRLAGLDGGPTAAPSKTGPVPVLGEIALPAFGIATVRVELR